MLSISRAARLAFLAERAVAHRAGSESTRPGWRARRAWRVLKNAADAGDQNAIEAVWQAWLSHPDDERWELLTRWRNPEDLAGAVFAVAVEPTRSASSRAALGAFCARHDITPDDDIRQMLFYALTGQHEQRRAADPEGTVITASYQEMDTATRAALRHALIDAGDLDLVVRMMAGSPQRATPVTAGERYHLTRVLAMRGEWERLWQMMRDLPLSGWVDTADLFGGGWRPADALGCSIFNQLRSVSPAELAAIRDPLAVSGAVHVRTVRGMVRAAALSADGRRLAVITWSRAHGLISLFDVPGETMVAQHRCGSPDAALLCYAGDALIACNVGKENDPDGRVLRCADGPPAPVAGHGITPRGSPVTGLAPTFHPPGGFAVLCGQRVTFCDAGGEPAGTLELPDEPPLSANARSEWSPLATEPGGRLAVAGEGGFAVYDVRDPRRASLLARAPCDGRMTAIRFSGPEHLVTITKAGRTRTVGVWGLGDDRPEPLATRRIKRVCDPVAVRGLGAIAVRSWYEVRFLDMTLGDREPPSGFPGGDADRLWSSPDGNRWAYADSRSARVFPGVHPALVIADRPAAEWVPADLETVQEALAGPAVPVAARRFLYLLESCLNWRFHNEVPITSASPVSGEDDITPPTGDEPGAGGTAGPAGA